MRRRDFLSCAGGTLLSWPLAAHAQRSKQARIGVLVIGNADADLFGKELRAALRGLGHVEGQTVVLDIRSADGQLSRLPALAADLVQQKSDAIIALYTPCIVAAAQATRDIPIIMLTGDALATGQITSLSRPGGNLTGLSLMAAETHAKCVELFKDMLPSTRNIAAIGNAADPSFAKVFLEHTQRAGGSLGVEIHPVTVRGVPELDAAFAKAAAQKMDAVVFQGSLPTKRLVELAHDHRMPTATTPRAFPEIGGLMAYGADGPNVYRRAAVYAHKILQGENPAEMPVEQPTKFELVINLKTAKALDLAVPATLIVRADQLIE